MVNTRSTTRRDGELRSAPQLATLLSSHAVYDLKYHFVWIPKLGEEIFMGEVAEYTREVLGRIGDSYGLIIDTVEVQEGHVHLFLEAPPRYSPAQVGQLLKGPSAREIFQRFP